MSARNDTLEAKKDAIRRLVSVACGAWTYLLDGHDAEGGKAVFAKRPNGAFTADMMAEQIRLFKPFFFTEATKNLPIGVQSDVDWTQTLHSSGSSEGDTAQRRSRELLHQRLHRQGHRRQDCEQLLLKRRALLLSSS